ncbi:capsular polysaccharide type 8 biosynthesis protein cap8A [Ruminiclostridium hungatei]|uniref:Capsular polysaccharide type 8 biosynthesis protein cap8A n=1 Tax=Ruminiclostridium hungatei TaxID=48256 RepID=A0A1V4SLT2_RUMHU|nr:Wzz/FepE/Etk N-terminal domain-containing protein [Ruminiclostridium hungatei]OPX44828.1 capsular polysaccharide type 8 biosynthesis protein cap8A [Ruminiclostridium hungatei]
MEFKRFFYSIRRMFWLVILFAIVGGGLATYMKYYRYIPLYEAETTVYALNRNTAVDAAGGISYQDVLLSKQLLLDYQEIITSEKIISAALSSLKSKYSISGSELRSLIYVKQKDESSILGISAVADSPKLAADASRAVTQAFITSLRELTQNNIIGVLDEAKVPQYPLPDDSIKKIIIGIVAGIVVAIVNIYIIDLFDNKIRVPEDVEINTGLKIIGAIPGFGIK